MLLQILTIAGIAVFAASGAVLGVRKDFDLWGILTVAILTGVGGGILRDLLLGVTPPTSLQTWPPVATAAIAGVVVFFFHPAFTELRRTIWCSMPSVWDCSPRPVRASPSACTRVRWPRCSSGC